MTASDLDIYRSAAILIEHHGDAALIAASHHEDAMRAKGDVNGVKAWQDIANAIRALQAIEWKPNQGSH